MWPYGILGWNSRSGLEFAISTWWRVEFGESSWKSRSNVEFTEMAWNAAKRRETLLVFWNSALLFNKRRSGAHGGSLHDTARVRVVWLLAVRRPLRRHVKERGRTRAERGETDDTP